MEEKEAVPNPFTELDQIAPLVTTQLQTFCLLAVDQLKTYPPLVKSLEEKLEVANARLREQSDQIQQLEARTHEYRKTSEVTEEGLAERLHKIEDFIAAIPAWKEAQVQSIANTKDKCAERCNEIMDKLNTIETSVKELDREATARLDALEDLAASNAEIRENIAQKCSDLGDQIESVDTKLDTKGRELKQSCQEHEARLTLLDEKVYDAKILMTGLQLKLETTDARLDPLEISLHLLRADLTAIERDLTGSSQQISSLELTTERLTSEKSQLDERIYILEHDARIPHLMTLEPRLNDFQNGVEDTLGSFDERMINLNHKVSNLGVQMDSGHPEMWKMHSTLEAAVKDQEQAQKDLQKLSSGIDHLQDNVGEVLSEASQRTQLVDDLLESQRRFELELVSQGKRQAAYTEEKVAPLAKKFDVDSLRSRMEDVKKELRREIEESKHTAKFDLLHDPSPQVDNVKAYLTQQENGLARLKERVAVAEESMHVQADRLANAEVHLSETAGKLQASVLNKIEEIPRMQYDVQKIRTQVASLADQLELLRNSKLSSDAPGLHPANRFSGFNTPLSKGQRNLGQLSEMRMDGRFSTELGDDKSTMASAQSMQDPSMLSKVIQSDALNCPEAGNLVAADASTALGDSRKVNQLTSGCNPRLQAHVFDLAMLLHGHCAAEFGHHGRASDDHLPRGKCTVSMEDLTDFLQRTTPEEVTSNIALCVLLLHFRLQDKHMTLLNQMRTIAAVAGTKQDNSKTTAVDPKSTKYGCGTGGNNQAGDGSMQIAAGAVHTSQEIGSSPKMKTPSGESLAHGSGFVPLSILPPQNFYAKHRDLKGEQERILALADAPKERVGDKPSD